MQGRLQNKFLKAEIQSECGHCGRRIDLSVDSELHWDSSNSEGGPLIFEPDIDWSKFTASSIVNDY